MKPTTETGMVIRSNENFITKAGTPFDPTAEEADLIETFEEEEPHFIEGNTIAISLESLSKKCVVPTWAGDNTLCISHPAFINAVKLAAYDCFPNMTVDEPEIRCSHQQLSRIPSALNKKPSELLPTDVTLYYQRMMFCIKLSKTEIINGKECHLCIGGVRALNNENLTTRKSPEKFKIFIGYRVKVCQNLSIFGDCLIDKLEVMSVNEIYEKAIELFRSFDPEENKRMLERLNYTRLTPEEFVHIIGHLRLYEAMSPAQRKENNLPNILLGDSCANNATRLFLQNPNFGIGNEDSISCWQLMNLLNESIKGSTYIDKFLSRNVNATEIAFGIQKAKTGEDDTYSWFLQ